MITTPTFQTNYRFLYSSHRKSKWKNIKIIQKDWTTKLIWNIKDASTIHLFEMEWVVHIHQLRPISMLQKKKLCNSQQYTKMEKSEHPYYYNMARYNT